VEGERARDRSAGSGADRRGRRALRVRLRIRRALRVVEMEVAVRTGLLLRVERRAFAVRRFDFLRDRSVRVDYQLLQFLHVRHRTQVALHVLFWLEIYLQNHWVQRQDSRENHR